MIKSFFKIFTVLFLIILISFVGLYLWGSSGTLDDSEMGSIESKDGAIFNSSDTLSVMTYNVGYLSGMNNNQARAIPKTVFEENQSHLIKTINQVDPDLIAFQEIDFASKRSYRGNQLDSIRLQTNLGNIAQVVNWDKHYVPFPYWPISSHFGEIVSGQAIASRFQIKKNKRVVLQKRMDAPFYYNAFYLDRLVQVNEVVIGEEILMTMNVHLEAFDQDTRQVQAKRVLELYNELAVDYPVILLGDFNANADLDSGDSTIPTILKGINIVPAVSDSLYQSDKRSYYTYSAATPDRKIDYIFYNHDRISLVDVRVAVEFATVSDHLPVLLKFTLR